MHTKCNCSRVYAEFKGLTTCVHTFICRNARLNNTVNNPVEGNYGPSGLRHVYSTCTIC